MDDESTHSKDLELVPIPGVGSHILEMLLVLVDDDTSGENSFDYYYHLVPHHPTMVPNLLEMLRVADFLDMKKVPRMLVNLFNWDPFIQYALAAYLDDKHLDVRMSEGLVCRGSSVDGIRHTAKVILREHASEYIPPLLKFWDARERDWAFFHSELLRGRLYHTSEHARQRCRSHGNMNGGAGLRDSDYAPWRREISDKIAKRPGLIDHPHKSIKDIVKRTMRCGYHPCIQPLEELLDRLKSMVWARMAKRINGDDIGPDDVKTEAKSSGPSGGSPMTARAVAPAIPGDEHALSASDGRDEDDEDQDEDEADDEEEAEQADDNPYKYEKGVAQDSSWFRPRSGPVLHPGLGGRGRDVWLLLLGCVRRVLECLERVNIGSEELRQIHPITLEMMHCVLQ